MSSNTNTRLLRQNRLLSIMPAEEMEMIKPHLEPISYSPSTIINQVGDTIRHVYFPNNGMVSLLSVTEQGHAVEVGYVGSEGLVGLSVILGRNEMPYQAMVQVASDGYRLEAKWLLKLFQKHGVFHDEVLRYVYFIVKQLSQTCVCNHFHNIEARLCRWLAVMCERSENNYLLLTQEFLANMLGVQRTSVGMIANHLQSQGIIKYRRGKVEVIDLESLRASACECYQVIKSEYDVMLKHK